MTGERPLSPEALLDRFLATGQARYHHRHPFHLRMHEGRLTRAQIAAWILNRYYYQSRIPMKDALILARSDDPEFRRAWGKRLRDHDGARGESGAGGLELWLRLAEAAGLERERVVACREVLPGTRFAVDAYLELVSRRSLVEAVASSLTELFSRDLIALRIGKLRRFYPWLASALGYFERRLEQAPEDARFALDWVTRYARTRHEQELAIRALEDKCSILWAQLDALHFAYVEPGFVPPGTFQ